MHEWSLLQCLYTLTFKNHKNTSLTWSSKKIWPGKTREFQIAWSLDTLRTCKKDWVKLFKNYSRPWINDVQWCQKLAPFYTAQAWERGKSYWLTN